MQALVNEKPDMVAKNSKYVMRITGDNEEGKAEPDDGDEGNGTPNDDFPEGE